MSIQPDCYIQCQYRMKFTTVSRPYARDHTSNSLPAVAGPWDDLGHEVQTGIGQRRSASDSHRTLCSDVSLLPTFE
jgi:hypothetical protein